MKRPCHCTLLVLLLFVPYLVYAQTLLPAPRNMVNDSAHLFSSEEEARIEYLLRAYRDSTTREIIVVTVNNFKGYDANSFATELGNQWGIGQRDVNNGVIVLLRPGKMPAIPLSSSVDTEWDTAREAYFTEDDSYPLYSFLSTLSDDSTYMASKINRPEGDYGEGYIATGRGMESALPDVLAARIMRNVVAPFFAAHRYAEGTEAALYAIFESLAGDSTTISEVLGSQYQGGEESNDSTLEIFLSLLICYIVLSLIWGFFSILFQSIGHAVRYFTSKNLRSQHSFLSYWGRESWQSTKRVLRRLPSRLAILLLSVLSNLSSSGGGGSGSGSYRSSGSSSSYGGGSSFSGGGGSFGGGGGGSRF